MKNARELRGVRWTYNATVAAARALLILTLAGVGPARAQNVIDQQQPNTPFMTQVWLGSAMGTWIAQTFVPVGANVSGVGLFTSWPWGGTTTETRTYALWDGDPSLPGSTQRRASTFTYTGNSAAKSGTQWIDAFWTPVSVTPGATYWLLFSGSSDDLAEMIAVGSDGDASYGRGTFALNRSTNPRDPYYFPPVRLDLAFREYTAVASSIATPEPGTRTLAAAGIGVLASWLARRGRRASRRRLAAGGMGFVLAIASGPSTVAAQPVLPAVGAKRAARVDGPAVIRAVLPPLATTDAAAAADDGATCDGNAATRAARRRSLGKRLMYAGIGGGVVGYAVINHAGGYTHTSQTVGLASSAAMIAGFFTLRSGHNAAAFADKTIDDFKKDETRQDVVERCLGRPDASTVTGDVVTWTYTGEKPGAFFGGNARIVILTFRNGVLTDVSRTQRSS